MESFTSRIPLGRWGIPDDIAKVALFLASPAADYMTGSLVVVDGGRLLG
ncbi:MAG: SDR family oxidoreductase [Thermaerobacter sp.]|nr:SDR family oxidoreductase [Thermaerobacter sp.]